MQAAGLGKLTVLSALGQPLRAEIELTAVSADEAAALVAKLAPADAFRQANIDFNPTLLSLRFAVEQRNGRQYIRVTSPQPVNDPFVDMLLELSWNGGRLVREYTFLLDPADMRQPQTAQVAAPVDRAAPPAAAPAPAAVAAGTAAPAAEGRPEGRPERAPRAAAKAAADKAPAKQAAATDYRVKSGDTLSRIAKQVKPTDVSLDVMLVALYRANPDAFSGSNMNRLRSGRILAVPDADSIRATAEGEAHGVVVAHAADFNAYRNKLAGQVALSTPAKSAEAGQSATGKITAKVEERATPANESKDQLKLSKAAPSAPTAGNTAVAGVEDKIAKEKQVAEAAARVKELEKNVSDLEKLMAVKSKAMQAASVPASAAASASAAAADPAASQPLASAPPVPKAKPVPLVKKTPPPQAEPSLLDTAMENINAIGIALAALLAGAGALALSRRKKKPAPQAEASEPGDPGEPAPAMFAEAGGQSVDTNNSVFNSNFAPSASQLDTNEVDPVAEADVYIAYGRDAQAEEILKEALRTHPERHPVRLKLLEIYATRKDVRAFEAQASELYALSKGQGEEWQQAAALGLALDPSNPLYRDAEAAPAGRAGALDSGFGASLAAATAATAATASYAAEQGFDLDAELAPRDADFAAGAVEQETALPMPAPADTGHVLDFDLGGLSFEPVSTTAPIAMPGPAADTPFDMAFDMPFDAPAATAQPAPADDAGMDFGLELDAPQAANSVAPAADPLMDLDLMNFDLPATPAAPAAAESIDDFFAKPALPVTQETAASAPEFDLSGIDLDLSADAKASGSGVDDPLSAVHMEMDTKLDLAIAYQEIGDKEGARELIDEVIKGGSDAQVAKANSMRALLG
ncbi:FimV/HubP family polar landmark protein [Janthinobacterium fluminis]|uniref:FimV/HubP family polar landmark protein n=1 Tax=Janthinobacterium fluminis TaxID=2987524 RepID=UPI0023582EB3|nr:FimV/HubP family polar landmark protein [Janthinobacterium fluminis]